ncbi:nicotinamide-nucleotide amidase [Lonsdalea quercina]|uniref:nicotinamide-nucleotide amidase n=1 Tax=Lonsdalea quercina TaxID=71657 RepID=UPI003974B695
MTEHAIFQLSEQVGERLKSRGAHVTCAESCTGGGLAKVITDVSGSSAWFDYGFVTYSNRAKEVLVGVKSETLAEYGAVSGEVVEEMASGALDKADADYAISISGVAGPDGGTPEKPVGTVWFGFAARQDKGFVRRMQFDGDRNSVRQQAVQFALETLLNAFLQN